MKAALFYGKKEDMRVETVAVPEISDGDVLLRVRACGICGSDARSYFNGIEERYKIPVIFGHEVTAVIEKVGGNVKDYKAGERVVVAPIHGCGRCEFCTSGRENLCTQVVVYGCTIDGAFAQYMKITQQALQRGVLVKIPDEISDEQGTMIEPFSCCLHGLLRLNIAPGDSVVVFGAGPIGIAHMMLAKRLGAEKVGVMDMVDARLEQAESFGADITINAGDSKWNTKLHKYFGTDKVDNVVTAAPSVAAINSGLEIIKNGGSLLIFGGLPHGSMMQIDPNIIHYNEINIAGSIDATIDDFHRAATMAPSLQLERFITHTFPLDEVKKGMEIMRSKQGMKVILNLTKS